MDKIALITGGNSGIGYATAYALRQKGCQVFITGRNAARLEVAAKQLGATAIVAEMEDMAALKSIANRFENGLDYLVNNAAVARFMPLKDITSADYTEFFNINIRGAMTLIQALTPALSQRQGSVCNVSSAIVNNGLANGSLYAATKGALESMTRSLALELAEQHIRVNVVSPGATETPILDKLGMSPEQRVEVRKKHESTIPLKRYAQADEVAQVIISQLEASYVTGAVWAADGGVNAY